MIHKGCTILLTTSLRQMECSDMIYTFQSGTRFVLLYRYKQKAYFTSNIRNKRRKAATKEIVAPLMQEKERRTERVCEYVNRVNPELLNIIPDKLLKPTKLINGGLYVINTETAEQIVSSIMDDLSKNETRVIELNPGIGLLTEKLLNAGVPSIHMYEGNSILYRNLRGLTDKYPDRLKLKQINLFKIAKLQYMDEENGTTVVEHALRNVECKEWGEDTCMQVIGATADSIFFRHIILSTVFKNCFMLYGRTTFYLVIDATLWIKYVSNMFHNTTNILLQTLFNYKNLGTVSRKSFLPWKRQTNAQSTNVQNGNLNMNEMHIIKIEPRPDLFIEPLNKETIIQFWYFIRHYVGKDRKRIIPELEKLIPDCGPRLIARQYTVFTEFTDLTPQELLDLFCDIKSWPEFERSHFMSALNIVFEKHGLLYHLVNDSDTEDLQETPDPNNSSGSVYSADNEPEICTNYKNKI